MDMDMDMDMGGAKSGAAGGVVRARTGHQVMSRMVARELCSVSRSYCS